MKALILCFILSGAIISTLGREISKKNSNGDVYHINIGGDVENSKRVFSLLKAIDSRMKSLDNKMNRLMETLGASAGINNSSCKLVAKNCAEVLKCGGQNNGVYTINPDGKGAFKVYCDQTTTGGGWTVFQRRKDGSVNFYRVWNDYRNGFGNLEGEFWLGLEKIYRLTHNTRNSLRVELQDTTGQSAFAEYDYFAVSSERVNYQLSVGSYSGTAGDSLSYHRGKPFTTKDRDHDNSGINCAVESKGAWWYHSCRHSNLNGLYLNGVHKTIYEGINWEKWRGFKYSASRAEMKIRPE